MHPLVAIGLVFLAAIAWLGTILTLLIALVKARRRPPAGFSRVGRNVEPRNASERVTPR
ncbi:hypothetical protein ACTAQI_06065 [Pseudarthrobacter sp. alpha12b]